MQAKPLHGNGCSLLSALLMQSSSPRQNGTSCHIVSLCVPPCPSVPLRALSAALVWAVMVSWLRGVSWRCRPLPGQK